MWGRNIRVWLKGAVWSSLLGELLEPILYLVFLGTGIGAFIPEMEGATYLEYVAPGLLVMGAMWSSSFENTYGSFTRMDRQKTYSAIVVTPVTMEEVVAGDILWGATKGLVAGAMMILVSGVLGIAQFPVALLCLPLSLLIGLVFASMALTVTALANNYEFFAYYFTVVLTPMFFISGTWFPVSTLPGLAQPLSETLPMTQAVTAARLLMAGRLDFEILPCLAWLFLYLFVFFTISVNLVRRRLIR